MYEYNEYVPITKENILDRVSEEDIFKIFIKENIKLNKEQLYVAPYRNDRCPDCYFEKFSGTLFFVDFADSINIPTKNCFSFISRCTNLSYPETLKYINNYFKLGLGYGNGKTSKIIIPKVETLQNLQLLQKNNKIVYVPRKFEARDKIFWNQYKISKNNLEEDLVIPISLYRFYNKKNVEITVCPLDIAYAYSEFQNSRVKIYRPYGKKKEKWLTNCIQDDIGSINHLPCLGEILIITKSYKDCRVLRNLGYNSVWFQNEGMVPNMQILKSLLHRFENVYIFFDNDTTGIGTSISVCNLLKKIKEDNRVTSISLPTTLLEIGIKDPSDLVKEKGIEELRNFLENKIK